jgi:hypothetical protein
MNTVTEPTVTSATTSLRVDQIPGTLLVYSVFPGCSTGSWIVFEEKSPEVRTEQHGTVRE